jgi:hypothetical protein
MKGVFYMDYSALLDMKERLRKHWAKLPKEALNSFEKSFDVEYAHNSTAIEGNTLTLIETKVILEDNLLTIRKEDRLVYFEALEEYAVNSDLSPFADKIAELEMQQLEDYLSILPAG